jgi:SAM-dependent methyltransferase
MKNSDKPWQEYENFDYRLYWKEDIIRDYEDLSEREALRKLLPQGMQALIDLGANYGRLTNEFSSFPQVLLADGAFSAMRQAHETGRKYYVECAVCDIRNTPFLSNSFDVVTCIRTMHHQSNIEPIFQEANRLLHLGGLFIFTFANKSNAKHRFLSLFGRSNHKVNNIDPIAIGKNIYNFHPKHVHNLINKCGFKKERQLGVGTFRSQSLGKLLSTKTLTKIDSVLQPLTGLLSLSPSIIICAKKIEILE